MQINIKIKYRKPFERKQINKHKIDKYNYPNNISK